MKSVFLHPKHPERTCWGCDRLCPANDLGCGNGTVRTQHPVELFGEDWLDFADSSSAPGPEESRASSASLVEEPPEDPSV